MTDLPLVCASWNAVSRHDFATLKLIIWEVMENPKCLQASEVRSRLNLSGVVVKIRIEILVQYAIDIHLVPPGVILSMFVGDMNRINSTRINRDVNHSEFCIGKLDVIQTETWEVV